MKWKIHFKEKLLFQAFIGLFSDLHALWKGIFLYLRALNLVYSRRNLRLFDAERRIISHQRSGLFVRAWCA